VAALCVIISLLLNFNLARTQVMYPADIPIGKVISVNGLKFVKIASDQYLSVCETVNCKSVDHCLGCDPDATNECSACTLGYQLNGSGQCEASVFNGNMQDFTPAQCNALPTPAALSYTSVGTMTDSRDGKQYEIRKFADGKCWMVDNLRYGGSTDSCAGRSAFSGNGSATATNRFGTNTYGDCRDPTATGNGTVAAPCLGTTSCGYYYNWQAAMQASGAYYNNSYTTPSYPHQGICPTGWHVPRGATGNNDLLTTYVDDNEFSFLDRANGGTGANNQSGASYTGFWKPTSTSTVTPSDPFKSLYSGSVGSAGALSYQGSYGYWWSSTQSTATVAYYLYVSTSYVAPQYYTNEYYGYAVRCVLD
jgi:uncharacterized protein (TIGR02145 family)